MHGVAYMLEAVPEVVRASPETVFLFVDIRNRSTNQEWILRRAAELGVADHVSFVIERSLADHPRYLSLADIFLGAFSSHDKVQRTLRGTVLEAMAMGKPVVHADTIEMVKTFKHGEELLLCRPEDPRGLAAALLRIIRDPELRRRLELGGLAFTRRAAFGERLAALFRSPGTIESRGEAL
jgi:glycosyltransferase involved in cell wall biosynthesis